MRVILTAEHFDLTLPIREHAIDQLVKIETLIPDDGIVRVYLVKEAKRAFSVILRVRQRGHDLITRLTGPELYGMITRAASGMRKTLLKEKIRKERRRRFRENSFEFEF